MATGKFNYFRHSVFARNDEKIKEFSRLLGRKGKEAYFYYFSLIEHCAAESEEGQTEFKIHNETLRSLWETNARGVQTVCKLCANSALVMCKLCANHVIFHIPNLPNYLGSYETKKSKVKERKEKESKLIKGKKNLPEKDSQEILKKPSPLSFLFDSRPDIQEWLDLGNHDTHLHIVTKYSHHEIVELVSKAFEWAKEKKLRSENWLITFFLNKNTHGYGSNQAQKSFSKKTNGVAPTPENPTGNPYIQEAIEKGLVG